MHTCYMALCWYLTPDAIAHVQETKKVVEEAGRKAILIPGDIAEEEHIKCGLRAGHALALSVPKATCV